ncbi:uncharacterized protein TrAtP1_001319 [Trichoderma atroviride]|uniref:uncharacterized protein n=1 Tax=Hypocrea atroviridis TaxID=63577 RepID=UPI00332B53A0|nr:hypothetical protein TrAtP1_001319 [Trichoderma atroviride]
MCPNRVPLRLLRENSTDSTNRRAANWAARIEWQQRAFAHDASTDAPNHTLPSATTGDVHRSSPAQRLDATSSATKSPSASAGAGGQAKRTRILGCPPLGTAQRRPIRGQTCYFSVYHPHRAASHRSAHRMIMMWPSRAANLLSLNAQTRPKLAKRPATVLV